MRVVFCKESRIVQRSRIAKIQGGKYLLFLRRDQGLQRVHGLGRDKELLFLRRDQGLYRDIGGRRGKEWR